MYIKDEIKRILISEDDKNRILSLYEQQVDIVDRKVNAISRILDNFEKYRPDGANYVIDLMYVVDNTYDQARIIRKIKAKYPNILDTLNSSRLSPTSQARLRRLTPLFNAKQKPAPDISNLFAPKPGVKVPLDPNKTTTTPKTGVKVPSDPNKTTTTPAIKTNYVRDVEVKSLQDFLIQYTGAKIKADGVLGNNTWNAIKNAGLIDVMKKYIRNNANLVAQKIPSMASMAAEPVKPNKPIPEPNLVR